MTYRLVIFVRKQRAAKMETKLTLRIKKNVIEKAKEYAQKQKISLSKMIEVYLESVTNSHENEVETTPLVDSLSGIIELEPDFDYKVEYSNYLIEKYK